MKKITNQPTSPHDRLFDHSPHPTLIINLNDNSIIKCNAKFLRKFGYTKDYLIGKPLTILSRAENIKPLRNLISTIKQQHKVSADNLILQKKNKQQVSISASGFSTRQKKNNIALLFIEKITPDNPLATHERYQKLFENMSSCVAIYHAVDKGKDFIFADFNKAAEKTEKIKRRALIGKRVTKMFPMVKEFGILAVFREVYKTGKTQEFPLAFYEDNRIAGWRKNIVYKLPTGEIVAIYDDITRQKQDEERIKDLAQLPENNPNPVMRLLNDGTIIYANKAAKVLLQVWKRKIGQKAPFKWKKLAQHLISSQTIDHLDIKIKEQTFMLTLAPYAQTHDPNQLSYINIYGTDITERYKLEQKYSNILETSINSFWLCDMQGNFIQVNKAYCKLLGYSRKELLSMTISDVENKETPEEIVRHVKMIKQRGYHTFGTQQRCKNGRIVDILVQAKFLPDAGGTLAVFASNITAQKTAARQLEESETRFRAIFERANDAIIVVDLANYQYTFVNPAACKITGYSKRELLQKKIKDMHPKKSLSFVMRTVKQQIQSPHKHLTKTDFPMLCKSGHVIYCDFSMAMFAIGTHKYIIGFFSDITEAKINKEKVQQYQKHLEILVTERTSTLNKTKNELETLIQNLPEAIYSATPTKQGSILFISQRWQEWTGFSPTQCYHDPSVWTQSIHPDDRKTAVYNYLQAINNKKENLSEYRLRHKSSNQIRYVRDHGIPVFDSKGKITRYDGIVTDITQLKMTEQKLTQSTQLLLETERVRALGTFAAGVAHELNNPLMGVLSFIQYALTHNIKNSRINNALQDAEHETLRCIDLTKSMLSFVHTSGEAEDELPKNSNIKTITGRILRLLKNRIDKNHVTINASFSTQAQIAYVQPTAIQQALLNIILNALDSVASVRKPMITISTHRRGHNLIIKVTDNGKGVPSINEKKIYEPFFTTKPAGEGTGLGLAITKKIILANQGKLTHISSTNKSTTFLITLPTKAPKNKKI
ncbi:MAG: PAS domain S-box protein [Gammaproteobacteria bacterium]|nr:PAS domain S-box protein [Gammaproteobacteria bacterium]